MSKNQENWDSEMPEQKGFNLTEGKHQIVITAIELVNTRFADEKTGLAKKALQITGNTLKTDLIRKELVFTGFQERQLLTGYLTSIWNRQRIIL